MISKRAQSLKPFIAMDILEKAQSMERSGIHVIHLELGEPDFATPECVVEAAIRAIRAGQTHYTHSLGVLKLREAICAHYQERYAVNIDPGQIVVTSGTSPAMLMVFSTILEESDQVIIPEPHYACYADAVSFAGGQPVTVQAYESDGFQVNTEHLREKIGEKTRAIFINSPSNPTGNLLSTERLKAIAAMGPSVISDEIYHGLVYEGRESSILEFTDRAFVLNGFSKLYAMTGWRLGYLIVPRPFMRSIQKIHQNFFISASAPAQWAAIAALTEADPDIAQMKAVYDERRKYMIRRLREIGFGITVEPTGAFYVFADAKRFSGKSYEFAMQILEHAHVGVTPGIDFGAAGEGYIRFSYANSLENIAEGLERIDKYLKRRPESRIGFK